MSLNNFDCYVIKYMREDFTKNIDTKTPFYFVFPRFEDNPISVQFDKNDFISCVHIPSLKELNYEELIIEIKKIKTAREILHLEEKKLKLQNQINEISTEISRIRNSQ